MQTPINIILKNMADNIRAQRLLMNYSQDYLAMRLNISQNAYSKIELGLTRVTVQRLLEIAHILEINMSDLMDQPIHEMVLDQFRFRQNAF